MLLAEFDDPTQSTMHQLYKRYNYDLKSMSQSLRNKICADIVRNIQYLSNKLDLANLNINPDYTVLKLNVVDNCFVRLRRSPI